MHSSPTRNQARNQPASQQPDQQSISVDQVVERARLRIRTIRTLLFVAAQEADRTQEDARRAEASRSTLDYSLKNARELLRDDEGQAKLLRRALEQLSVHLEETQRQISKLVAENQALRAENQAIRRHLGS
jgi:hypothetical protein